MSNIHSLPCTKRTRFTPAQIHALEELLDNTIDHKCLLDEAFETPRSNPAFSSNPDGHKGLAQLGDAILRLAIWLYASERGYSTTKEHSNLHDTKANNCALANHAFAKGLDQYVLVNPAQRGQRPSPATMATTVEALIAVVFIDSNRNLAKVRKTIIALGILDSE